MLQLGLNPYGLTFLLGLQGRGTPRAYSHARGLDAFIEIAQELKAQSIELHAPWLFALTPEQLAALRDQLAALQLTPIVSLGPPLEQVELAMTCAHALGARVLRLGLSPVLHGARASEPRWLEYIDHARKTLHDTAAYAQDLRLDFAIENHQDFGSEELIDFCHHAGPHCGICIDTGNTLAVAEHPLDFARRVAPLVRHIHLKDYRAQFTDEGFHLVRCPIGDGFVPFAELLPLVTQHRQDLCASLEPGALDVRHIRCFTANWWTGYRPRAAAEFGRALGVARHRRLSDTADWRTPWEAQAPAEEVVRYELDMIRRSMATVKPLIQGLSA